MQENIGEIIVAIMTIVAWVYLVFEVVDGLNYPTIV